MCELVRINSLFLHCVNTQVIYTYFVNDKKSFNVIRGLVIILVSLFFLMLFLGNTRYSNNVYFFIAILFPFCLWVLAVKPN